MVGHGIRKRSRVSCLSLVLIMTGHSINGINIDSVRQRGKLADMGGRQGQGDREIEK